MSEIGRFSWLDWSWFAGGCTGGGLLNALLSVLGPSSPGSWMRLEVCFFATCETLMPVEAPVARQRVPPKPLVGVSAVCRCGLAMHLHTSAGLAGHGSRMRAAVWQSPELLKGHSGLYLTGAQSS